MPDQFSNRKVQGLEAECENWPSYLWMIKEKGGNRMSVGSWSERRASAVTAVALVRTNNAGGQSKADGP